MPVIFARVEQELFDEIDELWRVSGIPFKQDFITALIELGLRCDLEEVVRAHDQRNFGLSRD